jgi:hypothetical protein
MATKTLKNARPTVNTESQKVTRWDCEVTMKDGSFERDYSYSVEADGSKAPNAYSKTELLAAAPAVLDEVFAHHKAVNDGTYKPETETVSDFDFDSLSNNR